MFFATSRRASSVFCATSKYWSMNVFGSTAPNG
jgi:hypothetical protein